MDGLRLLGGLARMLCMMRGQGRGAGSGAIVPQMMTDTTIKVPAAKGSMPA